MKNLLLVCMTFAFLILITGCNSKQNLGEFESAGAVGKLVKPGQVNFDASDNKYTLTGGGQNIWADKDAPPG